MFRNVLQSTQIQTSCISISKSKKHLKAALKKKKRKKFNQHRSCFAFFLLFLVSVYYKLILKPDKAVSFCTFDILPLTDLFHHFHINLLTSKNCLHT